MKICCTRITLVIILLCGYSVRAFSQDTYPYMNANLPVELRVNDLLSRMTPEEKFRQLFMIPGDLAIGKDKLKSGIFGLQVSARGATADAAGQMLEYGGSGSPAQLTRKINELQKYFREETRLGIPIIPFEEALHGLVCGGATAFPQSIGLAASFNVDLMHQVAGAIAAETRSRGIRQILSPVLNIARDVRWGRTEETYGEDPWLVSQMGMAYISELEKAGIIATPKHFAVNVGDGGRDSYPIHYNERIMEEIYFPAFKIAVQKAGARSLMTAYNSFDGSPCTASDWLLNKKLRNEWGFRGFTISDACAVGGANVLHMTASDYSDAGKIAVENGLDVIFQTDFNHINLFKEPFENGTVNRNIIDSAVARVLRAKFQLGLFEDPYTGEEAANKVNGSPEHRELAIQAARESIVLLKNEDNVLPVSAGVKTIAIIGTDAVEARLGGYSGPGNQKISILRGMKQSAPDGVEILYSPGCGRVDKPYQVISSENFLSQNDVVANGLKAEYFDNITLGGFSKLTRLDPAVNFDWTLYGPDPSIPFDWYSVRWTGKLKSSSTGTYKIGVEGNDGYRLYLGGKLLIDNWNKRSYSTTMTGFDFNKDEAYDLKLEYFESTGNARLKLVWTAGTTDTISAAIHSAVEISKKADLVICVVGIEEGEFRDRASLALPGRQEEMISALAETGKPLVVVLVGGSAVSMIPWIDRVKAIVDVWYPGEAGGTAVADVLYGNYNPAGRLPITFPISEGQLPLVYNHKPTGRGDDYLDLTGMALFPFGFGLSYTTFRYSDLEFSQDTIDASDSITVCFKIQNTGKTIGDEVWQLYIRDEISSVAKPVTELKGFGRVSLLPGQVKSVEMIIPSESLATLGKDLRPKVEPGIFRIMVGASSKDIRLRGKICCRE